MSNAVPITATCLILVLAGCASSSQGRGVSSPPFDAYTGTLTPSQSLETAKALMAQGDYVTAIPRLIHMMETDPDTPATREARYWLGMAYYHTNSYRDSITLLEEYLRAEPESKFRSEAQSFLDELYKEYEERYLSREELDVAVAKAVSAVEADPQSTQARLQLANALWKRGDYDEAGNVYAALIAEQPEIYKNTTISERIELLPNNEYIVLTPSEIERRSREQRPIVVADLSSFRSGRDVLSSQYRHYVVTGQLQNRGDSTLYGVRAHVTIYGFANLVYDTQTITFGRLNVGESRAFSVRFSNFDNIENIVRYECVADFDR